MEEEQKARDAAEVLHQPSSARITYTAFSLQEKAKQEALQKAQAVVRSLSNIILELYVCINTYIYIPPYRLNICLVYGQADAEALQKAQAVVKPLSHRLNLCYLQFWEGKRECPGCCGGPSVVH